MKTLLCTLCKEEKEYNYFQPNQIINAIQKDKKPKCRSCMQSAEYKSRNKGYREDEHKG